MGKNKKPMLTVLVEEQKLQRFRDYASAQGMSMGAVVNQLIDRLLSGESTQVSTDKINPIENVVNSSIGINDKAVEIMIATSIGNYQKSIEELIAMSIENNYKSIEIVIANSIEETIATAIEEHHKSIEKTIATAIDNYDKSIETLSPPLSLLDVEREARRECGQLIGSAIESVTTKNNAELTAMNTAWVEAKNEWWLSLEGVKNEHRQQIAHQHTEIARLRTMVDELMATNIESLTTTAIQPPNGAVKGWVEFCKMIGEPLPSKQIKDNTGELIKLAKSKGFGDWRYDSNKKRFNQQGGAGG